MARGEIQALGLSAGSFAQQASGASKTRRAMCAGAVVLALATVAAVAMIGGEAVKTGQVRMELSDRNEFESQPAWDQDWDLKDIQHHLVRTQRMQTAKNNKFVGDIARIDMDIEDLMKQVKKPGPTGPAGAAGKDGAAGPAGDAGANGAPGVPGKSGVLGAIGPAGKDGTPGQSGPAGVAGENGQSGPPGQQGPVGQSGPAGRQGPPGDTGREGEDGPEGPPGQQGPPGPIAHVHVIHHRHYTGGGDVMPTAHTGPYSYGSKGGSYDKRAAKWQGWDKSPQHEARGEDEYTNVKEDSRYRSAGPAPQLHQKEAPTEGVQHRQQALQQGHSQVDLADAVVGPAPTGNAGSDYKKRGSMSVSKVDANGYYYLNVAGEVGHEIRVILQGADGYHRKWQGFGQVYTGPVKAGNYGSKDFLQAQDLTTGETEYFRFQFL